MSGRGGGDGSTDGTERTPATDGGRTAGDAHAPSTGEQGRADALLSVRDLRVEIPTDRGVVRAVDGVSFDLAAGETLCLVGESGAGKTVTCEAVTGLLDADRATVGGSVVFDGTELTALSERALRAYRGRRIGHVFQHARSALDPVYTVGRQVTDAVERTTDRSGAAARERALELLDRVDLSAPAERFDAYPHQLSGGQNQRIALAMALAGDPELLVADEPTTALDVTTEAEVVRLLAELQDDLGLAVLYVTHDFGVVAELADRVAVLYGGRVVEEGGVVDVFEAPAHPYTRGLLRCLPGRGDGEPHAGSPPDATDLPDGCRFHPRCPHAVGDCEVGDPPPAYDLADRSGAAACVFYGPDRDPAALDEDGATPGDAGEGGDAVGGDGDGANGGREDADDGDDADATDGD